MKTTRDCVNPVPLLLSHRIVKQRVVQGKCAIEYSTIIVVYSCNSDARSICVDVDPLIYWIADYNRQRVPDAEGIVIDIDGCDAM